MSLRSIAIVAHVDHGKTSLLDHLLRQSGTLKERGPQQERVMDSNPQERERGITILAKCTALRWGEHTIQVVDTPGHQDFGGEVERVLQMVDSVLLLVDAVEGPMPQTRYVLRKALAHGFRPIVVVNKMDRPQARPDEVIDAVFDLFAALGAHDEQLDFPVVYASAREGWASLSETPGSDMAVLFETVLKHVPAAPGDPRAPLQLQVATLDYSEYLGRIAIGRIQAGTIQRGMRAVCCHRDGRQVPFRVTKLMGFLGLQRVDCEEATAGQIVALAGVDQVTIGETICAEEQPLPLPLIPIDEPTIAMVFGVNTSPFAGQEGQFVTSRQVRERLDRELEHNVGLRIEPVADRKDCWRVYGRGTLHLSVLIENMRREGYELTVGQPQVVIREGLEPWEEVVVTVPQQFAGTVIDKLSQRSATLLRHEVDDTGIATLQLEVPSRGLIGYRSQFLTDTRGEGTLYQCFSRFAPRAGTLRRRENGALIVLEDCETVTYGLHGLQDRGRLTVGPGEKVYAGQVIGLHSRSNDLVVNPGRKKQLTNIRAAGADEKQFLTPPLRLSLEEAIETIANDELVEVTPKSIRLRKTILDHNKRKRDEKQRAIDEGSLES